jgi:carbon monoxide dehydrogenase subunit G
MKISGNRMIKAPREKVWETLMDPETLRKSIPGVKEFNQIGENEWQSVVTMGVGPVKGSYSAKVQMTDIEEPSHYKLLIDGSGGPGWVKAEALFDLEDDQADQTKIVYDIDAQVGGLVAGAGQRLIGGVAKMIFKQFFDSIEKEIAARK